MYDEEGQLINIENYLDDDGNFNLALINKPFYDQYGNEIDIMN